MNVTWNENNTISVKPPVKPKKLTGTRFAGVLGLNRWTTEFQIWCEITKTYSPPFEDTIYTLAGKAIEPKQIQYMRDAYGMDDLIDPTQEYGEDYFQKTWGNFFTDPIFGGMWDAITKDENGNVTSVLEFKTTKRVEDWENDVPEYYALQAALYAYLLGCDDVIMVVSFLGDGDYEHPEDFVPSVENTTTYEFSVSTRYPNFEDDYILPATWWWNTHVLSGVSPVFDEAADREYLTELRNVSVSPSTDTNELLEKLVSLTNIVSKIEAETAPQRKRIGEIKDLLKTIAKTNIGDNKTARIENDNVICTLSKNSSTKIDEDAMKNDGVWDKYAKEIESSRFTVKFL